ncbi:MAG: threonine ammonia-lyase, partial [Pseudonocardia sp.]
MDRVTLDDVRAAAQELDGVIIRTPVQAFRAMSELAGVPVVLKCENLQRAGSFKIRGAYTRLSRMPDEEKARGVVAASAGNHAQGVALAAQMLGIHAIVYMPVDASVPKHAATRGYGAEVHLVGETIDGSIAAAIEFAERTGAVFVHPFDHPDVIAGQGTVGLELGTDAPDVTDVLVSIGGGGLIAG